MPKLKDRESERKQQKIERSALRVFVRQGYHGTSMREIAEASGVSLGNIYNYFRTKEELFTRLVERYETRMEELRRKTVESLDDVFEPDGLKRLAAGVRDIVYNNPDYWRLMYIDVVEFGNRHFAHTFRDLARNMEALLGDRLRAATRRGVWNSADPALAFTAVYLQLFTYFLVEKLFGGKQHLGVPDEEAVAQLVDIATRGLWREMPGSNGASAAGHA